MIQTYLDHEQWRAYLQFLPAVYSERIDELLEEHWAWRGMDIHIDRLPVPTAPLKLIIVHGGGAYGRVIIPLASRLGMEIIAPDLPGYGLSTTNGHLVEYGDWVDCVADLVQREREHDARPIVLFGGSMGGMLAYSAAARVQVEGLITTCFLNLRDPDARHAISRWPWLDRMMVPLLNTLPFMLDRIRVPTRWLTHMSKMANDPAIGVLCASDPLGGGGSMPLRWLRTFLESSPGIEPELFTTCPVLLAHPGADSWTPLRISQAFFDRLNCNKRLVVLEGAGHFPTEPLALAQLDVAVRDFLASLLTVRNNYPEREQRETVALS